MLRALRFRASRRARRAYSRSLPAAGRGRPIGLAGGLFPLRRGRRKFTDPEITASRAVRFNPLGPLVIRGVLDGQQILVNRVRRRIARVGAGYLDAHAGQLLLIDRAYLRDCRIESGRIVRDPAAFGFERGGIGRVLAGIAHRFSAFKNAAQIARRILAHGKFTRQLRLLAFESILRALLRPAEEIEQGNNSVVLLLREIARGRRIRPGAPALAAEPIPEGAGTGDQVVIEALARESRLRFRGSENEIAVIEQSRHRTSEETFYGHK